MVLDIYDEKCKKEIETALLLNNELEKLINCYILILTNFKRKSETIISLSVQEYKRRIVINKEDFVLKV